MEGSELRPRRTSLSSTQSKEEEGVRLGEYLSWIKNEMDNENACLELPFTIILLLSFSCLSYLHLQQSQVFALEGAVRFDIVENANFAWAHNFGHKNVFDVNSVPDFWSWFRIGFLPLIVQHSWAYSEDLPLAYAVANASHPFDYTKLPERWPLREYGTGSQAVPIRNDYIRHSRIVGGVRLRQEGPAGSYELCRIPSAVPESLWRPWLGKPCLPADPAYELSPEPGDAESFGEERRLEWFLPGRHTLDELRAKALDMEDGCSQLAAKGRACLCRSCSDAGAPQPWLDEQSRRVEVAFIVYNAEYGLISLVTVNFFFNLSGMIRKHVHVQSSWANEFNRPLAELVTMVTCDLVWILSLTYVLVCEVLEVIRTVRASKQRWYKSLWEYIGLWNMVDWTSIACAVALVGMHLLLASATAEVNEEFARLAGAPALADLSDPAGSAAPGERLFNLVEIMCSQERSYRSTFIAYPVVVMLRLFKSFDAQPRLAVVTRTLVNSASDMTHFFIVFFSVYVCMTVDSILLFGQDVEEFATLHRATITCFQMMFGSWDYDRMRKVGLAISALWLWIFVLVISVLLLNMLLAILMDAYGEVKSNTVDARTLFRQSSEILRRRREFLRGKRVRLTDVWDAFFRDIGDEKEMLESTVTMTPSQIVELVPGMKMEQATRTLKQAKQAMDDRSAVPYTQDNVATSVGDLTLRARFIREEAQRASDILKKHNDLARHPPVAEKTGEPRMRVVKAVRGVVEQLREQLSGTLAAEGQLFEGRQTGLVKQHDELLVCARDAQCTFQDLRARSDRVAQILQRHLQQRQQEQQQLSAGEQAARGGMLSRLPWASCSSLEAAPVQRISSSKRTHGSAD